MPVDRLASLDAKWGLTVFTVGFCQGLNPVFCAPGGSAPGIDGVGSAGVTVRNGIVADFAGVGVTLDARAHVEDLLVRGNGAGGIRVLQDSLVESNRVFLNPGFGISLGTASGWGSNVLRANGTNFIGEPVALSQNACSGRPCQTPGRRYYLSDESAPFATRETSCDPGFRVPNAQEFTYPASLVYDDGRGVPLENLFVSDTGWVDLGGGPALCAQDRWSETGWDFITANIASGTCTTGRRSWCIEE